MMSWFKSYAKSISMVAVMEAHICSFAVQMQKRLQPWKALDPHLAGEGMHPGGSLHPIQSIIPQDAFDVHDLDGSL